MVLGRLLPVDKVLKVEGTLKGTAFASFSPDLFQMVRTGFDKLFLIPSARPIRVKVSLGSDVPCRFPLTFPPAEDFRDGGLNGRN